MPFTVDVHHHFIPDFYSNVAQLDFGNLARIPYPSWSKEEAIAFMDSAGIDVGITSITSPGVLLSDADATRDLARRCNETAADLIRSHPSRFGGFASLPLPNVDRALEELTYSLDVLKLDGVVLLTNFAGFYLGDSRFDALFEELQRRAAVVFVHPTACPDRTPDLGQTRRALDYLVDTSFAIANLHYSKTFARTPDVKYIFSHAGGMLPYVVGRLTLLAPQHTVDEDGGPTIADCLRQLYYDTATAYFDPVLHTLRTAVGLDRVVFGTDFPMVRRHESVKWRQRLEESAELNTAEVASVLGETALSFLPRLGALGMA